MNRAWYGARRLLVLCFCSFWIGGSALTQTSPHHARPELVSQTISAAPGRELWLALHFRLDPGWHVYWTNPGDSGQPPVLKWQLPAGFSAGEIQWPAPEKLRNSQLADYGYKDEVALLVPVQVPRGLKEGDLEEIEVQASWLVCREVCIPEKEQLRLSLPVSRKATDDPAHVAIFATARKRLPRPWPAQWKAAVRSLDGKFVVTLRTGTPVHAAEFFPLQPLEVDNPAPQEFRCTSTGAQLTLRESDQLLKPVAVLKGVLVVDGHAYQFQAPVAKGAKRSGHGNSRYR
jgi:DsbC/DsbD-like thiol-disulfide interchange protein